HAHRERRKSERDGVVPVVPRDNHFIGSHPAEMVNVTRFRQTHSRMDQERAVRSLDRSLGHLFVRPVQWIASLKSNHIAAPQRFKQRSSLARRETQSWKVVMTNGLENLERSGNTSSVFGFHFRDQRMTKVSSGSHFCRHILSIPAEDFRNLHHCQYSV